MTENQRRKRNFRKSKRWKQFKAVAKSACEGIDLVTGKKLYKGWQLHHFELDEKNYEKLDDVKKFLCCNRKTHEFLHWAYEYYKKDEDFITRFSAALKIMKDINEVAK